MAIATRRISLFSRHYQLASSQICNGFKSAVGAASYNPRGSISTSMRHSSSGHIHILGVGNLGRLFAHALAKADHTTPITLLLHRESLVQEWEQAGCKIQVTTDGVLDQTGTFNVELTAPEGQQDIIDNLIVTTKAIKTVSAVSAIKHRLTSNSTILLTQNGMGTAEELTEQVFRDASSRPNYLACVTSHGVYSQGPFRSVHAGLASIAIGRVAQSTAPQYLIDKVVKSPVLSAREVTPPELLLLQLQKLVVNAMINPLTVIFNCRNGDLFNRNAIMRIMRLLLREGSQVIESLPELQGSAKAASRFSEHTLLSVVLDVAEKTAKNTSSMLQDVRAGRDTEIDYINGYIVKRGISAGVDCSNNEKVVQMVKEGKVITVEEASEYFQ